MPLIAFLGCDGSGKSTVIKEVTRRLGEQGHTVSTGHWRPTPFGKRGSGTSAADDPHGQPPRGFASSVAKLGWLWINWWAGWLGGLARQRRNGWVLYDRYHGDLVVDPKRYRYGGPQGLARLASATMPQPDKIIFLDAPADVLLARKQEVAKEALESLRDRYLRFGADSPRFLVVDCACPVERVVETVMTHLHE